MSKWKKFSMSECDNVTLSDILQTHLLPSEGQSKVLNFTFLISYQYFLLFFHLSLVITKILFKDQEISLWSTCCRAFFLPFSSALDKYWTRYLSHYQRVGQHFFCIRNGKDVSDFLFVLWIYFFYYQLHIMHLMLLMHLQITFCREEHGMGLVTVCLTPVRNIWKSHPQPSIEPDTGQWKQGWVTYW